MSGLVGRGLVVAHHSAASEELGSAPALVSGSTASALRMSVRSTWTSWLVGSRTTTLLPSNPPPTSMAECPWCEQAFERRQDGGKARPLV